MTGANVSMKKSKSDKRTRFIDQATGREMFPLNFIKEHGGDSVWVPTGEVARDGLHPSVAFWFSHTPAYDAEETLEYAFPIEVEVDEREQRRVP